MIPGPPRRLQPSLASGARRRPAHLGRSAVAAGRPEWSVARPPCSTRRPDPTRGDATVRLLHSGPPPYTTFVHRVVRENVREPTCLWTQLWSRGGRKMGSRNPLHPLAQGSRTSPNGDAGRARRTPRRLGPERPGRIARPTGERWTTSSGQLGGLRMAPQESERTGRLAATGRQARATGSAGRPHRQSGAAGAGRPVREPDGRARPLRRLLGGAFALPGVGPPSSAARDVAARRVPPLAVGRPPPTGSTRSHRRRPHPPHRAPCPLP